MAHIFDPNPLLEEAFINKCVVILEDGRRVLKQPLEPTYTSLMRDAVRFPDWFKDGQGKIWFTRAVNKDKLQRMSWIGWRKCTYKELGFDESIKVPETKKPSMTAEFYDTIVCKVPEELWRKIVSGKIDDRNMMAKRAIRGAKEDINKTARDKYGVKRKEGIATGKTFEDKNIDNIGKK